MLTLVLAGCGPLAFLNDPPDVYFLSPESGEVVSQSQPLAFAAHVEDDNDSLGDLQYQLMLADGTDLGADIEVDEETGTVTLVVQSGLPRGEPTFTLRVLDSLGESATAERTLVVFDNLPPRITWRTPVEDGAYAAGLALPVEVEVLDPDPLDDTLLRLAWSGGAAQGSDDLPAEMSESGVLSFALSGLSITRWSLTLAVTDALEAVGESTVNFDVIDGDRDNDDHLSEAVGGDDCDDSSAAVHPGIAETCNDRDDDCDAQVDEEATDAQLQYRDDDGDGYGNGADALAACDPLAGRVLNGDDCDDGRAEVNPDAVEVCNGLDDDCNGDSDSDATDKLTVWLDFDEDGYGAGEGYETCSPARDEVFNDEDCDDGDDTIFPGAPELCDGSNDDEDCDGLAGNDDPDSTGTQTVYADSDGDGFGDPSSTLEVCVVPGGYVQNADDCDDTTDTAWLGGAEVCEDGLDFDCDGDDGACRITGTSALASADVVLSGSAYAAVGTLVRPVADLDADGIADFAVTGNYNDVSLVRAAGLSSGAAVDHPTLRGTGSDLFGYAFASTDDLDGDGVPEIFVAAPFGGSVGGGAVYLFDPTATADQELSDALATYEAAEDEALGLDVAGPFDVDGDSKAAELLVSGEANIRAFDASLSDVALWSLPSGAAGSALSRAPDCDGDGLDDVLVGVSALDSAFLVYGGLSGDLDLLDADVILAGTSAGDGAGATVAGLGDVDGDGAGDLLVGAPGTPSDTTTNAGAVYLWTEVATAASAHRMAGLVAGDRAGIGVGAAGDVDADGFRDVLIGATGESTGGASAGAVYLFYGAASVAGWDFASPDALLTGTAGDTAGESVSGLGDLNGDGVDDLGVGAVRAGSLSAGELYVLFGGSL